MRKYCSALLLCWVSITLCQAHSLTLKPVCTVSGEYVKLSELVANPNDAKPFNSVFLGKVPPLGEYKNITLAYIKKRLGREGYITYTPVLPDKGDAVSIRRSNDTETIPVAATSTTPPKTMVATPTKQIPKEGNKYKYYILRSGLSRGTTITSDMVDIKKTPKLIPDAAISIDNILGHQLERTMAKGSVLTNKYLTLPPLIRKGDTISIKLNLNSGIKISGVGKAMESGFMGDTIQVRRNREVLLGKISGSTEVTIRNET